MVHAPSPFFVGPGTAGPGRRLLLISYHFPPGTAAGALRWQKLAGLAAERGFSLDVVTLDPETTPGADRSRLDELPAGTRLFGVPHPVLRRDRIVVNVLRAARRLRPARPPRAEHSEGVTGPPGGAPAARPGALSRAYGALFHYAEHGRWANEAAAVASQLASTTRYAALVTCGPPHMAHVAGARIARSHGLPFVADFRDPWRLVDRLADSIDSPLWRWRAARLEPHVVARASLVVMNTEPARDAMRARYPRSASRIIAVMNGFDAVEPPATRRPHKFTITYTGSIYLDRNPRGLFVAARRLIERRSLTPEDFGIRLVGNVDQCPEAPTTVVAERAGVEPFVELLPYRPRADIIEILGRSTVLVSLPQDSHLAIPSKVFEYMEYDAWMLALAEPQSATARLLADSPASVVAPGDTARMADILTGWYDAYRRGDYPVRLAADDRFSRRAQAQPLFEALEHLGATAGP